MMAKQSRAVVHCVRAAARQIPLHMNSHTAQGRGKHETVGQATAQPNYTSDVTELPYP